MMSRVERPYIEFKAFLDGTCQFKVNGKPIEEAIEYVNISVTAGDIARWQCGVKKESVFDNLRYLLKKVAWKMKL